MGKVGGGEAGEMKKRKKTKKKGRPSLLDLRMRNLNQHQQLINNNINFNHNNYNNNNNTNANKTPPIQNSSPNSGRRSTRRNPNSTSPDSDSDDDQRKKKKVKLVERLPASNSASHASDDRSDAAADDVVVKAEKVTEALQGSPLESGPTAPLPDKKLLIFILDRLQKKDTYGVFSEPVDPDELPDYQVIIKNPMDFGTVRKKLDDGSYSGLDDFESDVLLICANAMQYNAPDTVYFRQAKSIQDIAKRDFQNLRQVNDEGEPQPRIVRRGRPPNLKKALGSPPLDHVGPESSSDAILATGGDLNNSNNNNNNDSAAGSNSYNLRKGLPSFRFQSTDAFFRASPQPRNSETYADYATDWNSEFPAKILKAEAKHGKKQFSSDENRRATYKQFHPSAFGHDLSSLITLNGNMKQLIGVGLYSEHGYARSLARFAANLGPVVWKIASKKIEKALPSGVKFGPGWVGENEALPPQPQTSVLPINNLIHDSNSGHHQAGPPPFEAVPGQISYNEQSVLRNSVSRMGSGPILEAQQKHLFHNRNGFNHLSEYDFSAQAEMLRARLNLPTGGQQSGFQGAYPMAQSHYTPEPNMGVSSSTSPQNISAPVAPPASEIVPSQQHRPYNSVSPVPPDLNMRFQAPGSPNSSFRIGSPQPDLALQL